MHTWYKKERGQYMTCRCLGKKGKKERIQKSQVLSYAQHKIKTFSLSISKMAFFMINWFRIRLQSWVQGGKMMLEAQRLNGLIDAEIPDGCLDVENFRTNLRILVNTNPKQFSSIGVYGCCSPSSNIRQTIQYKADSKSHKVQGLVLHTMG